MPKMSNKHKVVVANQGPCLESGPHSSSQNFHSKVAEEEDVPGFIAVHVGAGYHSPTNSELYKKICREACLQAIKLLKQKKPALEVIKAAVISLENSPWTNAGLGSNLTVNGTVECDASIMDGHSLQYGAVGAVAGVHNPIEVAKDLLETQLQGNLSLGRIPPSTLVGQGARDWAERKKLNTVKNESLVTDSSRKFFIKHKRRLDMLEEGTHNHNHCHKCRKTDEGGVVANSTDGFPVEEKTELLDCSCTDYKYQFDDKQPLVESSGAEPDSVSSVEDNLLDTVGAVAVDHCGNIVAAVSSGGIVLKQPGRLGQAALYGCGCWAENYPANQVAVGVSTSGCGEHLTKTLLARECAQCLKSQEDPTLALNQVFQKQFLNSPFLCNVEPKLGGALAVKLELRHSGGYQGEVLWAHTTDSMCLAFMSTNDKAPKALVSRLPDGIRSGKSCVVQSQTFTLLQ